MGLVCSVRCRFGSLTGYAIGSDGANWQFFPPIFMRCPYLAMALSVVSKKAGRCPSIGWGNGHAQDCFLSGGGARLGLHAGSRRRSFFIGSPQHGQETMWGGFGGGMAAAPMSRGRPVWKAIRSRLALAAGWQKP